MTERVPYDKVRLPKRHVKKNDSRPEYPLGVIPEPY